MKNIEELLNSLKDHGTIDSEGSFTVSLSEARRKLTEFHSSDKQRYLILLVSGGTAAQASEIEIEQSDRSMTILFRRAYLPEAALLGAFEGQQDSEHSEAATDLILGLKTAFANDIERIEVEVSHPTKASYYWDMRPDGEETQSKNSEGPHPRILLILHARIGVLDKVRRFFRGLVDMSECHRLCNWSTSIAITLLFPSPTGAKPSTVPISVPEPSFTGSWEACPTPFQDLALS